MVITVIIVILVPGLDRGILCRGYFGIMEKNMETTTMGYTRCRGSVYGLP